MLLSSKEEHTRMFYRGARCCDSSCERKFGSQMKNSQEGTIALSQLMLPLLFYFYLQLELRKYCIIFFLLFKISQFLFLKFHRGASFYDYSFEKKKSGNQLLCGKIAFAISHYSLHYKIVHYLYQKSMSISVFRHIFIEAQVLMTLCVKELNQRQNRKALTIALSELALA